MCRAFPILTGAFNYASKSMVMDVYNSVSVIMDLGVPVGPESTEINAGTEKALSSFQAFRKVLTAAPESMVLDVYGAVLAITDVGVPAYLKSEVNGAGAEKAYLYLYLAFLTFEDVANRHQVSSPGPVVPAPSGVCIGAAV